MKILMFFVLCFSVASWGSLPNKESALRTLVFDQNSTMEVRWLAYHKLITQDKNESIPLAKRALKSGDWFLREAGLKTFVALKPEEAKSIAKNLFQNDPSLLVRVQALSAIKILKDKSSNTEEILWKSLHDSKNFRGDQSLWIRPKIVATLMEFKMGRKDQYKKLLDDKDPQIQRLAAIAIKKY